MLARVVVAPSGMIARFAAPAISARANLVARTCAVPAVVAFTRRGRGRRRRRRLGPGAASRCENQQRRSPLAREGPPAAPRPRHHRAAAAPPCLAARSEPRAQLGWRLQAAQPARPSRLSLPRSRLASTKRQLPSELVRVRCRAAAAHTGRAAELTVQSPSTAHPLGGPYIPSHACSRGGRCAGFVKRASREVRHAGYTSARVADLGRT